MIFMHYKVTVSCNNADVYCGDIYTQARSGREAITFAYSPEWLRKGWALSPDLPLTPGSFSSQNGFHDLRAFEDCMPDRWGRNLLKRAEQNRAKELNQTPKTLLESDFLVGVSDETRQGALRIWSENGQALNNARDGVPREVDLPHLLDSADVAVKDLDADIKDLVNAGSSLGGARPKATIRDAKGNLYIAKLPKNDEFDERDVCAWEYVVMQLSQRAGIRVMPSRLFKVGRRNILLVQRFDRQNNCRIPYMSGMTAISGNDGGSYSLFDLIDFIENACANPYEDIRELWLRALLTCAIGNTDNHMRNYGFIRQNEGWKLSPQFDVNPTQGASNKLLTSAVDEHDYASDVRVAMRVCEYFRVTQKEARQMCTMLARVLATWRRVAHKAGISDTSADAMATCFDGAVESLFACSL